MNKDRLSQCRGERHKVSPATGPPCDPLELKGTVLDTLFPAFADMQRCFLLHKGLQIQGCFTTLSLQ